jgi:hypothetical protein
LSSDVEVAELGVQGRLAPDEVELAAILAAVKLVLQPPGPAAPAARVPSWRFANRTWGKHAALLRTRPHRPNSF